MSPTAAQYACSGPQQKACMHWPSAEDGSCLGVHRVCRSACRIESFQGCLSPSVSNTADFLAEAPNGVL